MASGWAAILIDAISLRAVDHDPIMLCGHLLAITSSLAA
jgi:hypothetical protein